jgi:hypothetical protein
MPVVVLGDTLGLYHGGVLYDLWGDEWVVGVIELHLQGYFTFLKSVV